uniref:Uncharacterized protein n=1 Tax=Arundo donax TaxID=35708 RepID=A0A0A9SLS4_ARUDO
MVLRCKRDCGIREIAN